MYIKPLAKGLISFIPGSYELFAKKRTGGTVSARYCYSVWLRHLIMAYNNGLSKRICSVAELGPGDSLGIGLAALISGVNKYYALDVVKFWNITRNVEIFDELVGLFKRREKVPDKTEFPGVKPDLDNYEFPINILTNEVLAEAMNQQRLESIRKDILNLDSMNKNNIKIQYVVPWYDPKIITEESVDFIYSQAVLEHIDHLDNTYQALYRWLNTDGVMSHTIDFGCHGIAKVWNGHLAYPDLMWSLIRGKRPFLLNRQPHSVHINLMRKYGFEIVCDVKNRDYSGIQREYLARQLKNMETDDLVIRTAFIQARKK